MCVWRWSGGGGGGGSGGGGEGEVIGECLFCLSQIAQRDQVVLQKYLCITL